MATRNPADDDQEQDQNDLDPPCKAGPDERLAEGQDGLDEDDPDGLFLLLEENAKLRDLVVTLTDILLETFVEQGLTRQRAP